MKKIWFFLMPVFFTLTAMAQESNFSGTWVLKARQPIAGPTYANAVPAKMKVQQRSDSLIIEIPRTGTDGNEIIIRSSLPMNGKPVDFIDSASKRKIVKSLSWSADKSTLTLTAIIYRPENANEIDFTRVETCSLSPDGKDLYMDKKSIETQSETWQVKAEFEKEGR